MVHPHTLDDQTDGRDAIPQVEGRSSAEPALPSNKSSSASTASQLGKLEAVTMGGENDTVTGHAPPPGRKQERDQEIEEGVRRPESKEDWDRFIIAYTQGQLANSAFPSSLSGPADPLSASLLDAITPTQTEDLAQTVTSDSRPNDTGDDADLPPIEIKDFVSEHIEKDDKGDNADDVDRVRIASSPEPSSSALRTTSSSELAPSSPSQRTNSALDDPLSVSPSPLPSPMGDESDKELLPQARSGDDADLDISGSAELEQPDSDPSTASGEPVSSSSGSLDPSRTSNPARALRNQDPNIPNVAPHEHASGLPQPGSSMFRDHREGDVEQEAGLTRENMRQLDLQVEGNRVRERDGDERHRQGEQVRLRRRHTHSRLSKSSDGASQSSNDGDQLDKSSLRRSSVTRRAVPRVPRVPRSRGSLASYRQASIADGRGSLDGRGDGHESILLESGTGSTSNSGEPIELDYDLEKERDRVRAFFEKNGYMPAPKQTPENIRRRLRVIRRLGLENPGGHMPGLQRFTRLAATLLKAQMAMVSIIGKDKNWIIAAYGSDLKVVELESAFCAHTVVATGQQCLTVRDARADWRFKGNPFVDTGKTAKDKADDSTRPDTEEDAKKEAQGAVKGAKNAGQTSYGTSREADASRDDDDLGGIRFYAGSPLIVGKGPRAAIIGSLCLLDTTPRDFKEEEKVVLGELADCVVSELELIYAQRASIESAKLHQISVDFLRRSLKSRPHQMAGKSRYTQTHSSTASTASVPARAHAQAPREAAVEGLAQRGTTEHSAIENALLGDEREAAPGSSKANAPQPTSSNGGQSYSGPQSSSNKRTSGADGNQSSADIDIYDEACSEIRSALDAYAVAIVDLSQFHLFYPTFAGSSTAGSSSRKTSRTPQSSSRNRTNQESSLAGSRAQSSRSGEDTVIAGGGSSRGGYTGLHESDAARQGRAEEGDEEFAHSARNSKRARQTYALKDPTAPSRTPQVLYIPSGRRGGSSTDGKQGTSEEDLAVLGYSCGHDDFAFNFTSSPVAKKIISDFIAANVKNRDVWYTRDDSAGIAQSINHLMPKGTETSLAMPVFGFDGQVAFAVVACWTDPLYTYPAGALQFVETIAGSLLASVMKERLHQAERAQLNFAAAASHELRTPLHQLTAAATLLRTALQPVLDTPQGSDGSASPDLDGPCRTVDPVVAAATHATGMEAAAAVRDINVNAESSGSAGTSPSAVPTSRSKSSGAGPPRPAFKSMPSEDRMDALQQLDIIETNGLALGTILENLIDTLDIGRLTNKLETRVINRQTAGDGTGLQAVGPDKLGRPGAGGVAAGLLSSVENEPTIHTGVAKPFESSSRPEVVASLDLVLESVVMESVNLEERMRKVQGRPEGMDGVEVVLEVLPRTRGEWSLAQDPGPLMRALGKIIHNACKFTTEGYVHVTAQDVSRDVVLPAGYDNSIRTSIIAIDIKDTGTGMTPEFLESEVLRPFSKADSFKPGSGLGLGLAQRMIELLGGKLAIASSPGKGTLVHVEVPLHLYNRDNDSDQDDMAAWHEGRSANTGSADLDALTEKVRQDGIYLMGFGPAAGGPSEARVRGSALKRVGKSLLRQLKLNFCRVVPEIRYASLIIVPEHVDMDKVVAMCVRARPNVELVIIGERRRTSVRIQSYTSEHSGSNRGPHRGDVPAPKPPMGRTESGGLLSTYEEVEEDEIQGIRARRLYRPLRPSVLNEIMRPPPPDNAATETYISAVTGGEAHSDQDQRVGEVDGPDQKWSRVMEGRHQADGGAGPQSGGRSSTGRERSIRPPLTRTKSSTTARTSTTDRTDVSERTAKTAHTGSTLLPDEIRPSPVGSAAGSASSVPLVGDDGDEDDEPETAQSDTPSSRRGSTSTGSTGHSPKMSELREMGPIPESLRTIRADFEDALPALDHNTRRREPVRPSLGERRKTDRRSEESAQSGKSAGVVEERASSAAASQMSQSSTESHSHSHSRKKSDAETALLSGGSGRGSGAMTSVDRPASKEGKRRSLTEKSRDATGEGAQIIGNKLRVLVVEDNDVNRRILVTMLKRSSCEYAEAIDGFFAVDQFTTFRPHLVLLDINMPNKDGFQAAAEMRALERRAARHARRAAGGESGSEDNIADSDMSSGMDSPVLDPHASSSADEGKVPGSEGSYFGIQVPRARILAVTAMSSEAHRRRGLLECGIDEWMAKPVQLAALRDEINKCKAEMLG